MHVLARMWAYATLYHSHRMRFQFRSIVICNARHIDRNTTDGIMVIEVIWAHYISGSNMVEHRMVSFHFKQVDLTEEQNICSILHFIPLFLCARCVALYNVCAHVKHCLHSFAVHNFFHIFFFQFNFHQIK